MNLRTNLALCCLKLEKWDGAIMHCAAALLADKENSKAWYRMGLAHEGNKELKDAIGALEEARLRKSQ